MSGRLGAKSVVAACLLCCLGLLALGACSAPSPTPRAAAARPATRAAKVRRVAPGAGFAACEQRLERSPGPVLDIAGASFTAGTGPDDAHVSWAVQLAHTLRWNAVIDGVPGAGYVRTGAGGHGPAVRILAREDLAATRPKLVVLQLGHDDIGVPPAVERRAVAA